MGKIDKKVKTVRLRSEYEGIRVSGRRLLLRPYRHDDFLTCLTAFRERLPSQNKFDYPICISKESKIENFLKRLRRQQANAKNRRIFVFGLFEIETGRLVGQIDLYTINAEIRWGNIGYTVHNQFRGQGYAAEGARLAMRVAFDILKYHRIEAAMEIENEASERVARRIGMEYEGERRKFFADGGQLDMRVYATNAVDFR